MTASRLFVLEDMFKFNHIVMDPLVEVYSLPFLIPKILESPELVIAAEAPGNRLIGFILGTRVEDAAEFLRDGKHMSWSHGHISALAVAHDYRKQGLATRLLATVRDLMDRQRGFYVDLFVREKNTNAIGLYESLGYVKYRWMPQFYADDHGYEMRLPLSRDVDRKSLEGIMINKLFSFGNKLYYLLMLYIFGIASIIIGAKMVE
ncbi:N-alpha-acetyltransferase 20 [Drosophila teissieri]|uniref:N-alpha-acetyltransferase 20 n=1 Tax=Drosophila teissieri TaxID=7243 RepID=UPI001CB9FFA2|nr:N-alpha-acetyltransferase 20 [Drosophila teissieri]XP_043662621.1 N-alpha-acetyltransferase 20 [Drosophila teissieri]